MNTPKNERVEPCRKFLVWVKNTKRNCTKPVTFPKLYRQFQRKNAGIEGNKTLFQDRLRRYMKQHDFKGFTAIELVQVFFLLKQPIPDHLKTKIRNAGGTLNLDDSGRISHFRSKDGTFERRYTARGGTKKRASAVGNEEEEEEEEEDNMMEEEMDDVVVEEEMNVEEAKPQIPVVLHDPIIYNEEEEVVVEEEKPQLGNLIQQEPFHFLIKEEPQSVRATEILDILKAVSRVFKFPGMTEFHEQVIEELAQPGRDASMILISDIESNIKQSMKMLRDGSHSDSSKPKHTDLGNFLRVFGSHFMKSDDFRMVAQTILEEIDNCGEWPKATVVPIHKVMGVLNNLLYVATPAI